MQKSWYATLTADVLYDENLTSNEKILIALISNLSNERGYCFAGNSFFAKTLQVTDRSITRYLKNLEDKGYLSRTVFVKQSGEVDYRVLSIAYVPNDKKRPVSPPTELSGPPDEIVGYNNKYNTDDIDMSGEAAKNPYERERQDVDNARDVLAEIQNNAQWWDMLSRKVRKDADPKKLLNEFIAHNRLHEKGDMRYKDFKSYFRNWINKQIELKNKELEKLLIYP